MQVPHDGATIHPGSDSYELQFFELPYVRTNLGHEHGALEVANAKQVSDKSCA